MAPSSRKALCSDLSIAVRARQHGPTRGLLPELNCQLTPFNAADCNVTFTPGRLAPLQQVFASGVCVSRENKSGDSLLDSRIATATSSWPARSEAPALASSNGGRCGAAPTSTPRDRQHRSRPPSLTPKVQQD